MPNMDGTGPNGQGSLTGRGAGKCVENRPGRGRGAGFRCFGRGRGAMLTLTQDEQKKILLEEKKDIENKLKELE